MDLNWNSSFSLLMLFCVDRWISYLLLDRINIIRYWNTQIKYTDAEPSTQAPRFGTHVCM